ncbi:hypothetical protein COL922a_013892, partial [Colletotrichum nupharicola]
MKEDSEEDDDNKELKRQLAKANSNIKQMQGMFNESAQAINKLQEAFQQVTQQAAKLKRTLKGFLIQVKNYQNFHHRDFANKTKK